MIIEIESKTHEAPYSDTFVCKEAWLVLGSEKDPKHEKSRLSHFYKVEFHKYTMFKSQITAKAEEGIAKGLKIWNEYAIENGHFNRKSKEPSSDESDQAGGHIDSTTKPVDVSAEDCL